MAIQENQTKKSSKDFATCKECAEYCGIENIPEWLLKTELCLVHVNKDWCREIIEAIDTLKKAKITARMYEENMIPLEDICEEVYDALLTLQDEEITGSQYHGTKISCKIERKD
jgi:hypothetical protein